MFLYWIAGLEPGLVVLGGLQECLREAFGELGVSMKSIRENSVDMCSSTRLAGFVAHYERSGWVWFGSRLVNSATYGGRREQTFFLLH